MSKSALNRARKMALGFLTLVWLLIANITQAASVSVKSGVELERAIIDAKAGDQILLAEGRFEMANSINIVLLGLTLTGQGKEKTILDFTKVRTAAQGILVGADNVTLKDFAVVNTPGDGVVARGVSNLVFDGLKVSWQAGIPVGGYGLYPVLGRDVTIKNSEAYGASEAGIYVGQTIGASIENNRVAFNVVGIDVENSSRVQVVNNISEANSVGLAVTGRPHLSVLNPRSIRVFGNQFIGNNRENFSPRGAFSSMFTEGIAIFLVAVKDVVIRNNNLMDHNRAQYVLADFEAVDSQFKVDQYHDPYIRKISIDKLSSAPLRYASVSAQFKTNIVFAGGRFLKPFNSEDVLCVENFEADVPEIKQCLNLDQGEVREY